MERYIAVDNVCAWPNLTLMPDGAVVATIFNQPTHGAWEGDVECWASTDQGRTWKLRGVPAPHEPGTNRMNVAAGLAHDNSLIVLASGWDKRTPVGTPSGFDASHVLPLWVCQSGDGGRSWKRGGVVNPPSGASKCIVPFGDIVRLPDNALGVCIYTDERNAGFYVSVDGGSTWKMRGVISNNNICETTPVVLPNGRLLAAARTCGGDQHLNLFESADQGATWSDNGPVTLARQMPGHLLVLKDGSILLCYGIRNRGLFGIGARISEDQGKTWCAPRVVVNFTEAKYRSPLADQAGDAASWYQKSQDGGYPSSVQMDDGTIVTAYYSNGISTHQRYHMGVVRWQVEE